ncbi:MAG: hypothetical protein R3C68_10875 [Myxococcota bacterium]
MMDGATPDITTGTVVEVPFYGPGWWLRVPSFNELEGLLADGRFQRLLGERGAKRYGKKLFSADVIVDVVGYHRTAGCCTTMVELVKGACQQGVS